MKSISEIAVMLSEAIEDKIPCFVEIQPIREVDKDSKKYFLCIDNKRFQISESIAVNAIKWHVPVKELKMQYEIANLKFTI